MASVVCKVGIFVFPLSPEREIDINDSREVAKLDIPGAPPKYQDMGKGEKTISWDGALVGDSAMAYATGIQLEMHKGTRLHFTYGPLNTMVRIKNFDKKVRRFDYIRYSIQLVEDLMDPVQHTAGTANNVIKPKTPTAVKKAITKPKTVQIKQGETLSLLAKRYHTTWQTLAKLNGIVNPRKIPTGKIIKLP
ncbi:LysM domain-containing protein [Aneurinibacillus sp. Ricciae_BoGa-3]|uniref:LysM peptidoglycan-binding domain-containing protein n=1 Tax=Aneurinibacillus sp. Ricciae_BoGa-3 TaxID=3022697 RepID=UPI002341D126|nr:LysM domain-containing protein [Aneurinibacillus sp. Ricciae_BoGa-3]WCK53833.1 LysM domain-containing protein [Aneurinibacillus sp. Ricciae_BoGa-3]